MANSEKIEQSNKGHPPTMADVSQYKVGVVISVQECGKSNNKPLRSCQVNVGDGVDQKVTVVTSASNVREGSRYVLVLTFCHTAVDMKPRIVGRQAMAEC